MSKNNKKSFYIKLLELVQQRRLWASLGAVYVVVALQFGLPILEGLIEELAIQIPAGITGILAAWSYLKPK